MAFGEKIRLESAEPAEKQEKKLSPEKEQLFNSLVENVAGKPLFFKEQVNRQEFDHTWNIYGPSGKKGLLETREVWLKMKAGGEEFKNFFTNKIRATLNSKEYKEYTEVYRRLGIYVGLYGNEDYQFFGEMLDHETVWASMDGSNIHNLLGYIEASKNHASAETIIKYIDHALSPEYKRKDLLSLDLSMAAAALKNVVGEEKISDVLQDLADKDPTFKGWFEKAKMSGHSFNFYVKKMVPEEFDQEKETAFLEKLRKELEELEKNPPSVNPWIPGPGIYDSYDDYGHDDFGALEPTEKSFAVPEKSEQTHKLTKLEIPSSRLVDVNTDLESDAKRWEDGKILNFYGRFRPKIENPVAITKENYLAALMSVVRGDKAAGPEEFLNILSGVISKEDLEKSAESSEHLKTTAEAYKIAALAFARGLSVGVLENRWDNAISEVDDVRIFIEKSAGALENQADADFLGSLCGALGQLTVVLGTFRENPPSFKMPESADAFIISHPSFKRSKEIVGFKELLAEKIRWYLANDLSNNTQDKNITLSRQGEVLGLYKGPSLGRLMNIIGEYYEGLNLYKEVEEYDIPVYWDAKEAILNDFKSKRNVVFGRDGRYFFTALKAAEFGQEKSEQRYVVVSSNMRTNDPGKMTKVAKYLQQNGVTLDFNFIDTGFSGSIPEFAIKCLANSAGAELSAKDIDERIKLLSSKKAERAELIRRRSREEKDRVVEVIEHRPKSIDKPNYLEVDEHGQIKPEITPRPIKEQLQAWVVEHVSLRNFAPKLDLNR